MSRKVLEVKIQVHASVSRTVLKYLDSQAIKQNRTRSNVIEQMLTGAVMKEIRKNKISKNGSRNNKTSTAERA